MKEAASLEPMALTSEPPDDRRITAVVGQQRSRLLHFIRRRVSDPLDAEDILQDVWAELVEANRLLMPIEHVTCWLFRGARNRITDLFRRKKTERLGDVARPGGGDGDEDDEWLRLEELLPSRDAGPDALLARRMLMSQLETAVAALPKDQRDVFIAHEIEGRSFKEMAAETGVSINTLLSRKRYAVRRLRDRLRDIDDDWDDE
jgi:RNA polymerase sigma factor (sigma-70 family)